MVIEQLVKAGFFRVWINGEVRDLNELDTKTFTSFELVITRLRIDAERRTQITEAIEQAFELSKGNVNVLEESAKATQAGSATASRRTSPATSAGPSSSSRRRTCSPSTRRSARARTARATAGSSASTWRR